MAVHSTRTGWAPVVFAATASTSMTRRAVWWHQTWIDRTPAAPCTLEGRFESGAMRLEGQRPGAKPGDVQLHRITWTPLADGKVRQLWETSPDGKTWSEAFDGLYTRTK